MPLNPFLILDYRLPIFGSATPVGRDGSPIRPKRFEDSPPCHFKGQRRLSSENHHSKIKNQKSQEVLP